MNLRLVAAIQRDSLLGLNEAGYRPDLFQSRDIDLLGMTDPEESKTQEEDEKCFHVKSGLCPKLRECSQPRSGDIFVEQRWLVNPRAP